MVLAHVHAGCVGRGGSSRTGRGMLCREPCSFDTCAGCCDSKDECQLGTEVAACGKRGSICSACSGSGPRCVKQACTALHGRRGRAASHRRRLCHRELRQFADLQLLVWSVRDARQLYRRQPPTCWLWLGQAARQRWDLSGALQARPAPTSRHSRPRCGGILLFFSVLRSPARAASRSRSSTPGVQQGRSDAVSPSWRPTTSAAASSTMAGCRDCSSIAKTRPSPRCAAIRSSRSCPLNGGANAVIQISICAPDTVTTLTQGFAFESGNGVCVRFQ